MKRKIFFIAFFLLLAAVLGGLAALSAQEASAFGGGDGSPGNPWLITNVSDLQNMNLNLSAHYALNNNIDASGTSGAGFMPIGNQTHPFTGSFNGSGHTIDRLYINRQDTDYVGLFGYTVSNSDVGNVGIKDANITGRNNVGGLVGENYYGTVTDSYVTGNVEGANNVGGLVGENYYGTVTDLYATCKVKGNDAVGGLVGQNYYYGRVTDSYATGNVEGANTVGGLIGRNYYDGSVTGSYAEGNVEGDSDVGGLVGWNDNGAVTDSYAEGNVEGANNVGGLVGQNSGGTVTRSYAVGIVKGISDCVGGLVGRNYDDGSVTDSYAEGDVEGKNAVGGLVGENWGSVTESYAAGTVSGSNTAVGGLVGRNYDDGAVTNSWAAGAVIGSGLVGGLVGENNGGSVTRTYAVGAVNGSSLVGGLVGRNYNSGTVSFSFYDRQTTGQSDTGKGVPKTTAEMRTLATFTDANWDIVESGTNINNGYPYLSWQLPDDSHVWYVYRPPCPPPEIPDVPYPVSDVTNVPVNVTLSWAECADASLYNVYFGTSTTPTYYGNTNTSSYSLSQLPYSTTFYWRVVAVDDCGSTWGPVWSFTTECAVPSQPQTPSPGNNSVNFSTSILLSWNASVNASLYDVYFGTSATPTYHGNTSNSSYQLPLLNYSTIYYWQVVARNVCGNNSSGIWNFATVNASRQVDADIMGTIASWAMDDAGALLLDINESSPDGNVTINMSSGTIMRDGSGQTLGNLSVTAVDPLPAPPLEGGHVLAAFDFRPDGAIFDPGFQITLAYDPDDIPDGMDENDLFIGIYNNETGEWQYLSGMVNAGAKTIMFTVTHFTTFAVLALPEGIPDITPEPTPTLTRTPTPTPTEIPLPVDEDGTPGWLWILIGLDGVLTLGMLSVVFIMAKRRRQKKQDASGSGTRLSRLFRIPRLRRAPTPPESEQGANESTQKS